MSGNRFIVMLLSGLLALAVASDALARAPYGRLEDLGTGRLVAGPAGWLNWCMGEPGRCTGAREASPLPTTPVLLDLLSRVQRKVNASITSRPEPPGRDLWRADAETGDCEDYALAKRALLLAAGLPAGAVRLATATSPWGELHAVLTVDTDRGTLVLDNLQQEVVPFRALRYTWHRVESARGDLAWLELEGSALGPAEDGSLDEDAARLEHGAGAQ